MAAVRARTRCRPRARRPRSLTAAPDTRPKTRLKLGSSVDVWISKKSYDAEGNLISRTDATGVTTFSYDLLNRVATKAAPGAPVITTSFDGAGNLISYNDATGTAYALTYGYDAANQLTSVGDGTRSVTYTYGGGPAGAYTAGRVSRVSFGGGPALDYTYTPAGRVAALTPAGITGQPGYAYSYLKGSTQTDLMWAKTEGTTTTNYDYDEMNRLRSASGGYTYGYDDAGNLTSFTVPGASYSNAFSTANQLCWRVGGVNTATGCTPPPNATTFSYDQAGNLTSTSNGFGFAYNAKGQATSITVPGQPAAPAAYADAGMAERVSLGAASYTQGGLGVTTRTDPAGTTHYARDPAGRPLWERVPGGATYYYLQDAQHNIRVLFDPTGTIAARYDYQPYGTEVPQTQPNPGVHDTNPWRFAGGENDLASTIYHYGARTYNTAGQFWQQDTYPGQLTDPASTNRYAYAGANPISFTDLGGQSVCGMVVEGALLALGAAVLSALVVAFPEGIVVAGVAISVGTLNALTAALTLGASISGLTAVYVC